MSWYEASAYAEFAGKSLPVIAQWFLAAPSTVAKYIMPLSNFSASPAPVGKYQGLGPWGTYDMAGNVAEWCRNESGGGARYLLGGGWNTTTNEYFEPGGLPPFHRGANAGFRCVRNTAALPVETTAERRQTIRDFSKAKPATDAVFQIYKTMYSYDHTPLNAKLEAVAQDSPDWRKEKVTFDAAYGNERMTAYLFLPAHVRPPYQTVVFFPSARARWTYPRARTLADMKFIDYVIQSGRAVVYPVYKGTYERTAAQPPGPDTAAGRETLIQDSKDLGRSIDYLETRPDFDRNRIGYMGVSMGAAVGVNLAASGAAVQSGDLPGRRILQREAAAGNGPGRFRAAHQGADAVDRGQVRLDLPGQGRAAANARHSGSRQKGGHVRHRARCLGTARRPDPRGGRVAGQVSGQGQLTRGVLGSANLAVGRLTADRGQGGRPKTILVDAQAFDSRFECLPRNAEFGGGTGRAGYAATTLGQRGFDYFYFAVCDGGQRIGPWWTAPAIPVSANSRRSKMFRCR